MHACKIYCIETIKVGTICRMICRMICSELCNINIFDVIVIKKLFTNQYQIPTAVAPKAEHKDAYTVRA